MEKITVENLSFTYPLQSLPALRKISFTAEPGAFVLLCGKSGCGKSTLLRCLKPLLTPQGSLSGRIFYGERAVSALSEREQSARIGFVLQNPENQTVCDKVWHELAFGVESLGLAPGEIRARTAEMASFFGIRHLFDKDVCTLSGGEKQILALASVMVMQPSVLLLDEPTAQLDPIAAHDFLQTLARINREFGTTVLLSEHRLEEAFPLADRVLVLEGGAVLTCGAPREVARDIYRDKNGMREALPTPTRVFCAAQGTGGAENAENVPITVREGRRWLEEKQPVPKPLPSEPRKRCGEKALAFEDVWFRYEKSAPDVLKGLSLDVCEGEFCAILGGNGAGKSTALSVLGGLRPPYRGKVRIYGGKKVALLPQNPVSVFSHKTVREDLEDIARIAMKDGAQKRAEMLEQTIRFLALDGLLERHPYDLSGGEQQRAALAAVLLTEPDILVLDEPTKGLDAPFKRELAQILSGLAARGVTLVMVSHDVEFCAAHADRCALLFDGQIVSEGAPREFFAGMSFYTTAASRMARGILPDVLYERDILAALGVQPPIEPEPPDKPKAPNEPNQSIKPNQPANAEPKPTAESQPSAEPQPPTEPSERCETASDKQKSPRRTVLFAAGIFLLLVPLTVAVGVYAFGDRKYYFISLLILLETMLPFFLHFEGRKPHARELVTVSVLCAVAVAGRTLLAPFPEFKPVAAIVIVAGVCFGGETGFLVGAVTGFVSNFYFGQGPWTPWQMFAYGLIGFFAGLVFYAGGVRKTRTLLCGYGFLAALVLYGGVMNPASVIQWQPKPTFPMILSAFALGFPFDLIHALSTVFFLFVAAKPLIEKIDRVKMKYGF